MKQKFFPATRPLGILLLSTTLTLLGADTHAQWNGSSISTYTTTSNVGIGLGPVFDARLKLSSISDPSALRPGSTSMDVVPGFVLQRDFYTNGLNLMSPPKNILEVWRQQYTGPGGVIAFSPGPNQLKFVITADGYVGINKLPSKALDIADDANVDKTLTVGGVAGSSSSVDVLTVNGNITFTRPLDGQYRNFRARTSSGSLAFLANTAGEDGPAIVLNGKTNTTATPGGIGFSCYGTNGVGFEFNNYNPSSSQWNTRMRIMADGKVVIGNPTLATPNGYRLYVDDGILTKRIKVALPSDPSNWSDFVFADDYPLRSLTEVESYIKENKHLPEIPSAAEVHKEGLDLAQMDARLLQKVEELTLYMIAQQKEIESLKKELKKH